ncbi:MAG: PEPxxWA-CTERM sorting domain-containing protein [Pseudomonadota bacterium]|uniref:PEPxxWA-CTERM sorting domain-containing protein n=1 Tax=Phenylobacterium sp. TaxID=1871053 RepID=UPI0025EF1465|nr:PEPxxWA-CTERM sorting domain-containing protein [Phenylobacterium sp.]MBT9470025.1 PEP-CTERM sorting domain-containing protein [Phenylobacterium sp.]
MKLRNLLLGAAMAVATASSANAAVVVLDFEGVGNQAAINNFYNGGTDSQGHSGANYGVAFSSSSLGLIDTDAGGSGNFANEPSASTILFFQNANNAVLNYAAGFSTGFSFFYTSSTAATVNVYDGLNATGNLLGSLNLAAQYSQNCAGDPTGGFCNWTSVGVAFGGLAKSIDFGGAAGQTGFDNITFGSATPGSAVPEPATWAMMIAGFGMAGAALRRRRQVALLA